MYATEALWSDREVVLTAVQQDAGALACAADDLLEDPSFATEAKKKFHLLKLTALSGRSTMVAAGSYLEIADGVASYRYNEVWEVLRKCRNRLGLSDEGGTMELWHGSDRVPADGTQVTDWPGIQPLGEISEYQLLVTR
eukprot:5191067-Amphidinium_carterae.1